MRIHSMIENPPLFRAPARSAPHQVDCVCIYASVWAPAKSGTYKSGRYAGLWFARLPFNSAAHTHTHTPCERAGQPDQAPTSSWGLFSMASTMRDAQGIE